MTTTEKIQSSAPRVKLRDIADHLGLSVSTVSRAMAGHPAISASTRFTIQTTAAKLGYRLPMQGNRRKVSATHIVGVVVDALHNHFMTALLGHLREALQGAGYKMVVLVDSINEPESVLAFRPLIDGYLDGMVFATSSVDSQVVAELKHRGLPVVLVVRSVTSASVDTVEVDNVQAGMDAVDHLWELGHRRIAIVMGPRNTSTSRDRADGALKRLAQLGSADEALPVVWGEYTSEHGNAVALGLLQTREPPTAIVAGNDTIAVGVLEAARQLRMNVPGQLSVIGFDDIPLARSPLFNLSSISQPAEALAKTAVQRLVDRMEGRQYFEATRDVLPTALVWRNSTGVNRV